MSKNIKFEKHVFICANDKDAPKKCCGSERGMALVNAMKEALKERGLETKIRAQRASCLDTCGFGPSMVVYPEGVWYQKVELEDIEKIVEQHLVGNEPVEEKRLYF